MGFVSNLITFIVAFILTIAVGMIFAIFAAILAILKESYKKEK